jgi:hypothetical protein
MVAICRSSEEAAGTFPGGEMLISEAQQDLSRAYVGGGPGVMISGLVWLAAASMQHFQGVGSGFAALFFGGMLIFPISKLVCRAGFRRDNESSSNPFGMTILECTIAMIGGLFAAWLFLPSKPTLVFPLAAIAVGTHYFVFKTTYADRSFWLLAGIVTAIGLGDIFIPSMRGSTALLVSITELAFGMALTIRATASNRIVSPAADADGAGVQQA